MKQVLVFMCLAEHVILSTIKDHLKQSHHELCQANIFWANQIYESTVLAPKFAGPSTRFICGPFSINLNMMHTKLDNIFNKWLKKIYLGLGKCSFESRFSPVNAGLQCNSTICTCLWPALNMGYHHVDTDHHQTDHITTHTHVRTRHLTK